MGKKSKNLLPKKIAGVKVPKNVRKGRLGELLMSPRGQALIAEAVMAAGAVVGAKKLKDTPKARKALAKAGSSAKQAGDDAVKDAGAATAGIAYALGEAARSFADALHREPERETAAGDGPKWRTEPASPTAKKTVTTPETPPA